MAPKAVKGKIILVLGGIRSGKSRFALQLGEAMGERRVFIATGQALDPEMRRRIRKHQSSRSKSWTTYEEPVALPTVLEKVNGQCDVMVVDCLSFWLSNLLQLELKEKELSKRLKELLRSLTSLTTPAILISNEVGLGVIPANPLARKFCDHAGMLHQKIAHMADQVYFITSGISKQLK